MVLNHIKMMGNIALVMDELIEVVNAKNDNRMQRQKLNTQIDKLEKDYKKYYTLKKSVYEDWKNGDLSKEEYIEYKKDYEDTYLVRIMGINNINCFNVYTWRILIFS
jgi:hypothetical protein